MKAKEVIDLLRISRPTLTKYVKQGHITVTQLPNGRYDYDKNSVFKLLTGDLEKETCIYARVSDSEQRAELHNQIRELKQFCCLNDYKVDAIYSDIASGVSSKNRKEFLKMINEIMDDKIGRVIISSKDRLSRIDFDFFNSLFNQFNCDIIIANEGGINNLGEKEICDDVEKILKYHSNKLIDEGKIKQIMNTLNVD